MPKEKSPVVGNIAADQLKSYVDRIENLEEQKAGVALDIREVFSEAKSNGFDVKAMREILKMRKIEAAKRKEQEYMVDLYKRALQMDLFEN